MSDGTSLLLLIVSYLLANCEEHTEELTSLAQPASEIYYVCSSGEAAIVENEEKHGAPLIS